ncbi:MAG: Crp/Fnr family transcriptional regulator [Alphaproteobacteria bacterium]|nr:Crp/Fnr family transcriptional regulator [Alphaproteobacteria bacterium]
MQSYPRILDMLEGEERARLLSIATEKHVGKGQLLYQQGDSSDTLFIILEGAVKVHYVLDAGDALTTLHYRAGMVVGAHGCTSWSGRHSWTAQALVDCRLLRIRRADFLAFVRNSPQALFCVLAITEFKGEQLKRLIRVLAQPTLERKILLAVRHFASLYGLVRGTEIEIDGHITHQEIADMVGASRQSVTMLLIALEKSGAIRRQGRRLFVPTATLDS